jgi:hypothetical protein
VGIGRPSHLYTHICVPAVRLSVQGRLARPVLLLHYLHPELSVRIVKLRGHALSRGVDYMPEKKGDKPKTTASAKKDKQTRAINDGAYGEKRGRQTAKHVYIPVKPVTPPPPPPAPKP